MNNKGGAKVPWRFTPISPTTLLTTNSCACPRIIRVTNLSGRQAEGKLLVSPTGGESGRKNMEVAGQRSLWNVRP